ncbi:hypothetical protein ACTOB_004065 [Actinoplanes oblitus]|uniref:VOC domain-containing protein n=1 Tax=Actinoplanes oblitus TaxID=3040509 RepID=A0ABY8WV70_9ACTN|nr:hypothetical protein [Actinoplanes oblitus]WIN00365.1 hypothetical protein ACTOB_004065 [Actinoplanes oblitus]
MTDLVEDVDAVVGRMRRAGATVVSEPHVVFTHADGLLGPAGTEEVQAFLRDTEGNLVGLVEHRRLARVE